PLPPPTPKGAAVYAAFGPLPRGCRLLRNFHVGVTKPGTSAFLLHDDRAGLRPRARGGPRARPPAARAALAYGAAGGDASLSGDDRRTDRHHAGAGVWGQRPGR